MKLAIAAIGKMRNDPSAALTEDYVRRARETGRHIGFNDMTLLEYDAPRGLEGDRRRDWESQKLLASIPADAVSVCLDERGNNVTSTHLAKYLEKHRDDGRANTVFLIGGADGHDPAVTAQSDLIIAFGKATWPHMLVRAMLAEQIYRAMTILSGHPYHRS